MERCNYSQGEQEPEEGWSISWIHRQRKMFAQLQVQAATFGRITD